MAHRRTLAQTAAVKVAMLVLASGRGSRFGGPIPKVYVDIAGTTVLERSIQRLARLVDDPADSREIVLAVHPDDRDTLLAPLLPRLRAAGLDRVVDGGATRQQSMRRAFAACSGELVLVHDAARPFFPLGATREALRIAAAEGAAVLAVPVADTLKAVDADGRVVATRDRTGLFAAQTPQVLRRDVLEAALARADADGFEATDDVALAEHAGFPVRVVVSTSRNVKLTRAEDLPLAEWLATQPLDG